MRYDGRWHRRGIRIAYASDAPVSALLEVIAHTEAHNQLQHDDVLFEVRLDPDEHLFTVGPNLLPDDWARCRGRRPRKRSARSTP